MKPTTIQTAAVFTSAALALAGCSSLTPGENAAAFGAGAAAAGFGIGRAAGLSGWESAAVGAAAGAVVAATVYVIAKHQASERQRKLAEQRARVYVGRIDSSKKTAAKTRKPRYIAVDTVKDEKTSPTAKKAVMIYDTQTQEFVGNTVYDVEKAPAVGSTAKFDTVSAEYVGTGG
jgi:uncharacterized membrane protein YhiD involved in acid resistance